MNASRILVLWIAIAGSASLSAQDGEKKMQELRDLYGEDLQGGQIIFEDSPSHAEDSLEPQTDLRAQRRSKIRQGKYIVAPTVRPPLLLQQARDRQAAGQLFPPHQFRKRADKKAKPSQYSTDQEGVVYLGVNEISDQDNGYLHLFDSRRLGEIVVAEIDVSSQENILVVIPNDMINVNVDGSPGVITYYRGEDGTYATTMRWATNTHFYTLYSVQDIKGKGLTSELIEFAATISTPLPRGKAGR